MIRLINKFSFGLNVPLPDFKKALPSILRFLVLKVSISIVLIRSQIYYFR